MSDPVSMGRSLSSIESFRLKVFLNDGPGSRATASLSTSVAELTSLARLIELDPALHARILGFTGAYSQTQGSLELRTAVAELVGVGPAEVIITNGADEALSLLYSAVISPGDRVVAVAPAYGPLCSVARHQGAVVELATLREDDGWTLPEDQWRRLAGSGVRVAALNVPHNPTGWAPSESEYSWFFAEVERTGALVLDDAVYAGLDHACPGFGPCRAASSPNVVSVGSLSKALGLPGLRIGWIVSRRPDVIRALGALRTHLNTYVSSLSEAAALSAIRNATVLLAEKASIAKSNRLELLAFVARRPDLWALSAPERGCIALARWRGGGSAAQLSDELLEQTGLLVVPSELFDFGDRYLRFGYGTAAFPKHLDVFEAWLTRRP